ncbi:macrophage receptor MARCO-like [Saccostrea cucullata]|uniref:macrophage receptor MARCO-like n=1 Tax=Saccostrea cuccullata TaxID=36930 RepID=UPI002ED6AEEF
MNSNGQELEKIKNTVESQLLLFEKEMKKDFDSHRKYIESVLEIQKTQLLEAFERLRNDTNTLELQQNDNIRSIKQLSTGLDSFISVRFVNGGSHYGRVEVNYDGVWGTICDDYWDDDDANVTCKMKGYNRGGIAHWTGLYGKGTGQIWLDDVQCTGTESSLMECSKLPFGQHNCGHDEDASVYCY